jgi:hypothetical protein
MSDLKLARLPDRTPARLTVTLSPELKTALEDYRVIYNRQYDTDEPLSELVPHMLATFLASGRAFAKAREGLAKANRHDA